MADIAVPKLATVPSLMLYVYLEHGLLALQVWTRNVLLLNPRAQLINQMKNAPCPALT